MTPRGKLFLAGGVFAVMVVALAGAAIFFTQSTQQSVPPSETAPNPSTESPEAEDNHATDTEGEPLPEESQESALSKATNAARAYVTQLPNETAAGRQARLDIFFAPGSPVIEAAPPVQSANYSTGSVSEVEATWYNLEKHNAIGVLVYLLVGPAGHGSEKYSGWVVELRQYNNEWLPYAITESNLPYIEGGLE